SWASLGTTGPASVGPSRSRTTIHCVNANSDTTYHSILTMLRCDFLGPKTPKETCIRFLQVILNIARGVWKEELLYFEDKVNRTQGVYGNLKPRALKISSSIHTTH